MQNFLIVLKDNLLFFIEFLSIVLLIFLLTYFIEKANDKFKNHNKALLSVKKLAMIGLFSAISAILMLFELPLPFVPDFYKIDLSELPVLIISFSYGPMVGVLTEFCKILLKLLFKSSTTAFVGELANFVVGVSFILPASVIYLFKKNKKTAIIACIVATLSMTTCGSLFNGIYLLPKFASMYSLPLDKIIEMGSILNKHINSLFSFVLFSVVPFNLIKGTLISIISINLYKRISNIIKD